MTSGSRTLQCYVEDDLTARVAGPDDAGRMVEVLGGRSSVLLTISSGAAFGIAAPDDAVSYEVVFRAQDSALYAYRSVLGMNDFWPPNQGAEARPPWTTSVEIVVQPNFDSRERYSILLGDGSSITGRLKHLLVTAHLSLAPNGVNLVAHWLAGDPTCDVQRDRAQACWSLPLNQLLWRGTPRNMVTSGIVRDGEIVFLLDSVREEKKTRSLAPSPIRIVDRQLCQ